MKTQMKTSRYTQNVSPLSKFRQFMSEKLPLFLNFANSCLPLKNYPFLRESGYERGIRFATESWVLFHYKKSKDNFSRYGDSRYRKDKMVSQPSDLYNRNAYADKTASLYWNGTLILPDWRHGLHSAVVDVRNHGHWVQQSHWLIEA